MAKAIEQINGLTVGHLALGLHGTKPGTVRQQVHDGDTIVVRAQGNFSVRFLGCDTAEVSFTLPGGSSFVGLNAPEWEEFLSDPFSAGLPPFSPPLDLELVQYLQNRCGPGTAQNHARLAQKAQRVLEDFIQADLVSLGQDNSTFRFFIAFATDVIDRYGRFLGYINRDQPIETEENPRPLTYNERMLQAAWATPYFIWPNLNPFRKQPAITHAVIPPGSAHDVAESDRSLRQARQWIREARENKVGIFSADDPLRLLPFELRFLSRRQPPDRWVIDLGKNEDTLLPPQAYCTIENIEDRLFIPPEFLPLFLESGWKKPVDNQL
jgi:endonuclease YncB( thermonuclease family)